jgi:hypothetical protein
MQCLDIQNQLGINNLNELLEWIVGTNYWNQVLKPMMLYKKRGEGDYATRRGERGTMLQEESGGRLYIGRGKCHEKIQQLSIINLIQAMLTSITTSCKNTSM